MTRKKKDTAIVLSQLPDIVAGRKFQLWCRFFYDEKNKKTHLNATQSALMAYDAKDYNSAACIGYQNYKKLQYLNPAIADLQGFGIGERMKIALAKAMRGDYDDWDKLMVRLGDFEEKPTQLTQNNYNFNLTEEIARSRRERGIQL